MPTGPVGRGAGYDPPSRFERLTVEADPGDPCPEDDAAPSPKTVFFRDLTRTVLVRNESPDVPFRWGANPYRGCEHGCVYCYARPSHEYLGFSAGLDFETKIMVKPDAPALLRAELARPGWQGETVCLSGNTDCYQPVERSLRLTRGCLEAARDADNPVAIITKNALVARDADLLAALAGRGKATATLTLTTLDPAKARALEPRASTPARRLEAVAALARAGVPVGVNVSPVVPGLTDEELPAILAAARAAGARYAGWTMLRLPGAVEGLFVDWLARHFPLKAEKVLARLRDARGGALADPRFGARMRGTGAYADLVADWFRSACRRYGLEGTGPMLVPAVRRAPTATRGEVERQGGLFDCL
jgi:DNA repair photolyase